MLNSYVKGDEQDNEFNLENDLNQIREKEKLKILKIIQKHCGKWLQIIDLFLIEKSKKSQKNDGK